MANLVEKVPADSLYVSEPPPEWFGNDPNPTKGKNWTTSNWLKSRFHLNFAEYHGGKNQYGIMRVMNDDLVQPKRGFGEHSHANMEIVTYIVKGNLTHKDSMGTCETLGRGAIQFMTAGSGVRHSEFNKDNSPLRFIQMWFLPAKSGLKPNYGSFVGDADARKGKLHHLVSDSRNEVSTPVQVMQDVNIYASELKPGETVTYKLSAGRQGYVLCLEHDVAVTGAHGEERLQQHDAAMLRAPNDISFTGGSANGSHVLLVEMAEA
eukprot:m.87442 g.87442  ORF g.87442 m.87442 type:complete len:264 (+) comp16407_c0_seq1:594-1385(+)